MFFIFRNRRLETSRPTQGSRNQASSRTRRRDPDTYKCALCKRFHALRFCRKFLAMSPKRREEVVERYNYCLNCLAKSHDLRACPSQDTCRKCDKYHHTLLHARPQRVQRHPSSQRPSSSHSHHSSQRHQPSHRQPPILRQQISRQPSQPTVQSASPAMPDSKIIIEAIYSLAQVLCTKETTAKVA